MRKVTFVLATLMAVGVCLMLFGNNNAPASLVPIPGTCQVLLNNGSYDCTVVNSDFDDSSWCVNVSVNGNETFTMNGLLEDNWRCECEADNVSGNLFDTDFGSHGHKFVCGADNANPAGLHGYAKRDEVRLQGVFPFSGPTGPSGPSGPTSLNGLNGPFSFRAICKKVESCGG